MACQFCGHENLSGGVFCEKCGAIAVGHLDPRDPRLKEAKDQIRWDISKRRTSDRILSTWVIWIVVAMVITTYIVALLPVLMIFSSNPSFDRISVTMDIASTVSWVLSLIVPFLLAVLAYDLVKRHNEHSKRESWLKRDIGNLATVAASDPLRKGAVTRELQNLDFYGPMDTRDRRPWFWAMFVVLPAIAAAISAVFFTLTEQFYFSGMDVLLMGAAGLLSLFAVSIISLVAMLYMFHFLGQDLRNHEDRWDGFTSTSYVLLSKLGIPLRRRYEIILSPTRSSALYVVLAIFVPFYIYYWWYVLVKDPNEHYKNQWKFEDILLESIGS